MRLAVYLLLALATCSCSAVVSKHAVGEKPSRLEKEKWEGKWVHRDGDLTIKVDDSERGLLSVRWTEKGEKSPQTARIELLESNGWMFGNVNNWKDETMPEYVFARVRKEDRQITIWAPDLIQFKSLVTRGVLPGRTRGSDVVLGDLKSSHLKLIVSGRYGLLFEWEDPLALVKVDN